LNLKRNRQTRRGIFAKRPLSSSSGQTEPRAVEERAAACAGDVGAGLGAVRLGEGVPRRGLLFPLDLVAWGGVEEQLGGGEPETWLLGVARRWRLGSG